MNGDIVAPIELNPEAASYLAELEAQAQAQAAANARGQVSTELLSFLKDWFEKSKAWRKQSFESEWLDYQRNADSIYDPVLAKKKKEWQSKAFYDMTASHRENIHAQLYKLAVGARPPVEIRPGPNGDQEQADNIRDLTLRELDKAAIETAIDSILEDADTFGSGFCRVLWEEKVEDRLMRTPVLAPLDTNAPLGSPNAIDAGMRAPRPVVGYSEAIQPVVVYRGVRIEPISIWDFFPDTKALKIEGSMCAFRSLLSYGDILDGVSRGYYLPEAAAALESVGDEESEPADKQLADIERGIADSEPKRTQNSKRLRIVEVYGRLPQKWVLPLLAQPQPVTDPERLIPARVLFHEKTLCAVELNQSYDGEAPYLKMDFMRVNRRFYGRGIPEMLRNPQAVTNEIVNQRLDAGNLALNKRLAIIEKAMVDPRDLTAGDPFRHIRIDAKQVGPNGDVKNVFAEVSSPDVESNAGFVEVREWERVAQERTSANRAVQGSYGNTNDPNNTLGGQKLLIQQAGEKFAYIGMVQEFGFLLKLYRMVWKLVYVNASPEDIAATLGLERASRFQLMSPEEIDSSYRYECQGLTEIETRTMADAQLRDILSQFGSLGFVDVVKFFDQRMKNAKLNPDSFKLTPEQMMESMALGEQMARGQGGEPEKPGKPGEAKK